MSKSENTSKDAVKAGIKAGTGERNKTAEQGRDRAPDEEQQSADTESEFSVAEALSRNGEESRVAEQGRDLTPDEERKSADTESEFSVEVRRKEALPRSDQSAHDQ